MGEFRRSAEGDVDVAGKHFRDVRRGDVHAVRERGARQVELLHAGENAREESHADAAVHGHGPSARAGHRASDPAFFNLFHHFLQSTIISVFQRWTASSAVHLNENGIIIPYFG